MKKLPPQITLEDGSIFEVELNEVARTALVKAVDDARRRHYFIFGLIGEHWEPYYEIYNAEALLGKAMREFKTGVPFSEQEKRDAICIPEEAREIQALLNKKEK